MDSTNTYLSGFFPHVSTERETLCAKNTVRSIALKACVACKATLKMNLSSHLLVSQMTVLILALGGTIFTEGGQCSQVNVLSRETFEGRGDTVHYDLSHYFTVDNIVHVHVSG